VPPPQLHSGTPAGNHLVLEQKGSKVPLFGPNDVPSLEPAEAAALLNNGEILLLDVREADEWEAGHASGATHVPLGDLRPHDVPSARLVVTVCRSGQRSLRAATALRQSGVDARNLIGGMKAWEAQGLPVVRDDGSPGTVA
jgi:rhodanese-related sulfurtransferase